MNRKKTRQLVYEKYDGHCAYCGCELAIETMQIDHIDPVHRLYKWDKKKRKMVQSNQMMYPEKNVIDNMMPSCHQCNHWKNNYTIEEFREMLYNQVKTARKYSKNFAIAEKFGLVKEQKINVVFYFEKENSK